MTRAVVRVNTSVRLLGDGLSIAFDDQTVAINGLGAARTAAHNFLLALDPSEPYAETASRSGLSVTLAHRLVNLGAKHGFIRRPAGPKKSLRSARIAATLARRTFGAWKDSVFSHPLWRGLATGRLPLQVFTGWTLEHFHFIAGVTLRMPPAIAACTHRGVRRILSRHFREEYDHHKFFVASLEKLGLERRDVLASRPLPGTRAVVNWMRYVGERSWLSYACCSGFLESTGTDRRVARTFLEALATHYDPKHAGIVEPIAKHVALDEDYGHGSLLEQICDAGSEITTADLDRAFQDTYMLVETLQAWSTDILNHYAEIDPASCVKLRIRQYRPTRA